MRKIRDPKRLACALAASAGLVLASAHAAAQDRKGEHPMSGEVVAIDHDTGVVVVNTKPVPMTVHFPKQHVQELKTGDTITVHLSFEKGEKKQ